MKIIIIYLNNDNIYLGIKRHNGTSITLNNDEDEATKTASWIDIIWWFNVVNIVLSPS